MSEMTNWLKKIGSAVLKRTGLLVLVLIGTGVGFLIHAAISPAGGPVAAAAAGATQEYTCSMHPKVRLTDKNAKCPQCGMELILAEPDQGGRSLRQFSVSPAAAALMEIRVEPVGRQFVTAEIRMVGKLDYDETKLAYITAWIPGRLDRLYIDYTGIPVKEGDHLIKIYSPELLSAQQELLDALDAVGKLNGQSPQLQRDFARTTLAAARDKLRLLGLSTKQITAVESSGKVSDHVTISSPASGIVIHKNAREGMYVTTGSRIYTIADLTTMWVKLDAYESDLAWLRYGQKVHFNTEAYPGNPFTGTISFIDPILTDRTRTVKVRLIVPNTDGRLKPGMFVRAVARSQVAAGGKVMDAALAGKWISRHHPEIIKDGPGTCDICGIPLVRTEDLGYVSADPTKADKPLVIPVSAALVTGTRAVAYVKIDPSPLHLDSVTKLKWPDLIADLKTHVNAGVTGGKTPLAVFWNMLSLDLRKGLLAVKPEWAPSLKLQYHFMREVNRILIDPGLYDALGTPKSALTGEAQALLQTDRADLSGLKLTRLNRLLLAGLFPETLPAGTGGPTFEGRQIVLGPRAGKYYLVRRGSALVEGELVVTRGNFKIDSALQLNAKPSMMSPTGGPPTSDTAFAADFKHQLRLILAAADGVNAAMKVPRVLKPDTKAPDLPKVRAAFATLQKAVEAVDDTVLEARALQIWQELAMRLACDVVEGMAAKTEDQARHVAKYLKQNIADLRARINLTPPARAELKPVNPAFRKQLGALYAAYFAMHRSLASDKFDGALAAATAGKAALAKVEMKLVTGQDHMDWMAFDEALKTVLTAAADAKDIKALRESFARHSEQMTALARRFGPPAGGDTYRMKCPMAFDNRGATWLQDNKTLSNPYFGADMPTCGETLEVLSPPAANMKKDGDHGTHENR